MCVVSDESKISRNVVCHREVNLDRLVTGTLPYSNNFLFKVTNGGGSVAYITRN